MAKRPCGAGCPRRLALALLCPLPVFAAQAGAEIPVTVRTDGAACDTVYTVEITPLDNAPTPAQTSVQVKGGGTVYFTGLTFDAPGDYRYKLAQVKAAPPIRPTTAAPTL